MTIFSILLEYRPMLKFADGNRTLLEFIPKFEFIRPNLSKKGITGKGRYFVQKAIFACNFCY